MRFLIVSLAGSILAVALFNFLAYRKIDNLLFSMRIPVVNTGSILFREVVYSDAVALAFIVITFVLAARGIYVRMVRSLYRIRADIQRIIRGDLGARVMLREEEEFRDLAHDLNFMTSELNRRFSVLKERFEEIDALVRELRDRPERSGKILEERMMPQITAVEEQLREFKR